MIRRTDPVIPQNKKTIIIILLALVAVSGWAQKV